jgi:hypothetical protein
MPSVRSGFIHNHQYLDLRPLRTQSLALNLLIWRHAGHSAHNLKFSHTIYTQLSFPFSSTNINDMFYVRLTMHLELYLYNEPTQCTIFSLYYVTTPLQVSGSFVAHHQEDECIMWWMVLVLLLTRPSAGQAHRLLKKHLELECFSNSWGYLMHSLHFNTCNKNVDRTQDHQWAL